MSDPFGIVGVFATPDEIARAARQLRAMGLRALDAHTPFPVAELDEIVRPSRGFLLPAIMFVAAVIGAAIGYFLQYWDEALNYPLIVGGRPYNSWPAYMVGTVELMMLFAIAAGFFALLAACRLPRLYHPVFDTDAFARATRDRFVLCVEAADPGFEPETIRHVLHRLGAERIEEVRA